MDDDEMIKEYEESPDFNLKEAEKEEKLSDEDYDASQGFDYPGEKSKDSITKFFRYIINVMSPLKVVRVANHRYVQAKNSQIYLNMADFNQKLEQPLVAEYLANKAVISSSISMGTKGFLVTSLMTQRRIVQRAKESPGEKPGWFKGKEKSESGGGEPNE